MIAFQKKNILFNANIAKEYAKALDFVIIVEGYFDVIALYEAGIKNVVACMGTAISIHQLLIAARFSQSGTILLLLDGDEAGQLASDRASKVLEKLEKELRKNKQLVEVSQPLTPIMSTPKPWKKAAVSSEVASEEGCITLRGGSLKNVSSFAAAKLLVPKTIFSEELGSNEENISQAYSELKIKDCADLCELFTAHDVKKIMNNILKSSSVLKTMRWKGDVQSYLK